MIFFASICYLNRCNQTRRQAETAQREIIFFVTPLLDTVAFIRWVTGSGDDVLADNDCCVVPKQTALFTSPNLHHHHHHQQPRPLPSFLSFLFLCVGILVDKVQAAFFFLCLFFSHRIFPFFADQPRLLLHLLTSHLEWIMTREKRNKRKDSGKRDHVMTCLQLEAIGLCNFHTSHAVGEPRCAKTNIG